MGGYRGLMRELLAKTTFNCPKCPKLLCCRFCQFIPVPFLAYNPAIVIEVTTRNLFHVDTTGASHALS
jgi:hypothetical protein